MLKRGKDGDHLSHVFKSKQLRMAFKAFQCQASKEAVGVKNTGLEVRWTVFHAPRLAG